MSQQPPSENDLLTSMTNPVVKRIRSLQRRKFRQQERAFLVEGVRAVEDVLAAGIEPLSVILREDSTFQLPESIESSIRRVTVNVFNSLTDVAHPQGVLAVVPMLDSPQFPELSSNPLVVVLDGIRDPGNMGTLFRSAAGAGVDYLIIGPECVDPYHPKAVRAGMGAHLRVPFAQHEHDEISDYLCDFPVIALAEAGENTLYDSVNWHTASALVIGGEAFGPSAEIRGIANVIVSVPLANGVESLNAGVAGSLLMFEAARQRRVHSAT